MKRFLLVLALVAVAGATYVATAPGSQTAGPTARQFKALEKEVAKLKKQVGFATFLAVVDTQVLSDCMKKAQPVDQVGDGSTTGYEYTDPAVNSGSPVPTKALNYVDPSDVNALWVTGGDSACGADINAALRKAVRRAGAARH